MSRRLYTRCLLWLLPLLVARAFMPAGFMLCAEGGGLSLAFCPVVSPTIQLASAHDASQAHHGLQAQHHSNADQQHHGHHSSNSDQAPAEHFEASDTGVCPFAVLGSACSGAEFYVAASTFAVPIDLVPDYTPPATIDRLTRADRIRGPPYSLT